MHSYHLNWVFFQNPTILQLDISLQWEFSFRWERRKNCEFMSGGCICSPFIWSREHQRWCSINNVGTRPLQWNCTGSIFLFCISVSISCLAEEHRTEKRDYLCFGTYSYGKGSENPERLGLLWSSNIHPLSGGTGVPVILAGDPFLFVQSRCLSQYWNPSQHRSHRRMQCRTKRKLPALWVALYRAYYFWRIA